MSALRVFVTGSNKGVGKSIVKLLLQDKEEKIVYLTSRNVELGEKAVKDFVDNGLHPRYHQLDITNSKSIEALRDHLVKEHGGLDVLVNNAGIAYKSASTAPFSEQAEVTNNCNYFGTLQTCNILFPHIRNNGRVVHVSSMVSQFTYPKLSDSWKSKFGSPNLTIEELSDYMSQFVAHAKEDKVEENGWPKSGYGMSKVGVTFMAIVQQKDMDKTDRNIVINACCPGLVDTDMTGGKYSNALTPDEGAETPSYLALLPQDTDIRGQFLRYCKVCPYPPPPE